MKTDPDERAWWRRLAKSRGAQASLGVVVIAGLLALWLAGEGTAEGFAAQLGLPGAGALVVAQALIAVSPFPSQIVAVPIAVTYGFWLGVALNWAGWMLAALLQYGLSRRMSSAIRPF